MKDMIPMNEYGLMAGADCIVRVDSRMVADVFKKEHKNVLQAIRQIISEESGYSEDFTGLNFKLSKYIDSTGRTLPCYRMTRDGFAALAMGFTGKKADAFKEAYIKRFNEMEQQLLIIQSMRDQHPMLTEAIRNTHDDPKPWHYSNEADMLNRIVLGLTAKQYREKHSIPKAEGIRPHMTAEEATLMERLQMIDIGLQYSELEYQKRKQTLEWYAMNWRAEKTTPELTDAQDNTADRDASSAQEYTAA